MLITVGSLPTCYHLAANVVVDGIGRGFGKVEIVLLDNEVFVGMGNIRSVILDDEFLCYAPPIERDKSSVAAFPVSHVLIPDMDTHGVVVRKQDTKHFLKNTIQRQVGTKNGNRLSMLVADRNHIGNQRGDRVCTIKERL